MERLQQWAIDFGGLAEAIARCMEASGDVQELVPGRLWLLGKSTIAGQRHEFFLGCGLSWKDGHDLLHQGRLQAAIAPVVFVPGAMPDLVGLGDRQPRLFPLSAFLSLGADGLVWDRAALSAALDEHRKPSRKSPVVAFPVPAGSRWEDVVLTLGDHHMEVVIKDRRRRFSFAEAGFEDGRKEGAADRLWGFLFLLGQHGGEFPVHFSAPGALRQNISQLSKRLKALLPLDEEPFDDPRTVGSYRARFRIMLADGARFPTPPGASWDQVSMTEVRERVVSVQVTGLETFTFFEADASSRNRGGRKTAAEREGTTVREYRLVELGLTLADDRPNPEGDAFLAVLRAGGRVQRPKKDPAMLALNQRLGRFLGLEDPAFQYLNAGSFWVADFEAESRVKTTRS